MTRTELPFPTTRSRDLSQVRSNAGLSFDERIEIAAKAKHDETCKLEQLQRKTLQAVHDLMGHRSCGTYIYIYDI